MVAMRGARLDELAPAGEQLGEFGLFFWAFGADSWSGLFGKAGEDAGVERVGLGEPAHAVSELANALRVDVTGIEVRIEQRIEKWPFEFARGFECDACGLPGPQKFEKFVDAFLIVGEGPYLCLVVTSQIKTIGGNVDADEDGIGRNRRRNG